MFLFKVGQYTTSNKKHRLKFSNFIINKQNFTIFNLSMIFYIQIFLFLFLYSNFVLYDPCRIIYIIYLYIKISSNKKLPRFLYKTGGVYFSKNCIQYYIKLVRELPFQFDSEKLEMYS